MTDTPYLLVDDAVLRRNLETLAEQVAAHGLELRPHAKTHKCAQVARRQMDCGATGLTVATIGEAEAFAAAGFTDLFIAYPLWLSDDKAARLRALTESVAAGGATIRVGVDSIAGAQRLAAGLAGAPVEVMVEIDSGQHRTGVAPGEAGALAAAAREAGLTVVGVFTFPGHGYGPGDARRDAARQEAEALSTAAESLRHSGIEPRVISGGSTPTVAFTGAGELTEVRPGVYPFNDAQQVELGSCTWDDVALVAVATVVSTDAQVPEPRRRAVLDAGSKVLGADRPAWTTGFGRLPDHPDARITSLSEHHAVVEFPPDAAAPALGDRVRVAPNHVCSAVNLADELVAQTANGLEHWPLLARGANR
ncbi:alanine racemase [Gordonia caeni]|uniref:D-TA family PLP-dependent enzyme n=1 Tax=Gordonia caeni TaxID=1007097 RepID=A0ABP7PK90_9ACTN